MIRNRETEAVLTAIVIALVSIGCLAFVIVARIQEFAAQNETAAAIATETAGWETYVNTDYGFTLQYPPDWQLDASGLTDVVPFLVIGNPLSGMKTYTLQISIENNTRSLSSGEYVHALLAADQSQDAMNSAQGPAPVSAPQFDKAEVFSIGNSEAYELYDVFEFDRSGEQIYVAHGSFVLECNFPIAEENPNISLPVANNQIAHQIINTLVFTK